MDLTHINFIRGLLIMDELTSLRERISRLEASETAYMMVLAALLRHHPNYEVVQLYLTSLLEQQLAGGALGNTLTDAQKDIARDVVEWLQAVKKEPPQAPPSH